MMRVKPRTLWLILTLLLTGCASLPTAVPLPTTDTPLPTTAVPPTSTASAAKPATPPYTPLPPTFLPRTPETPTATPTSPPKPTGHRPPACPFPLPGTTTSETAPGKYVFSAPREPVPPEGTWVKIVGWLPDSQRVLLVQQFESEYYQRIEVFDPLRAVFKTYALWEGTSDLPVWVPGTNAVVYPEIIVLKAQHQNGMTFGPYEYQRQLRVSRGDPASTLLLEDAHLTGLGMSSFSLAVEPRGGEIAYLTGGENWIYRRDPSFAPLQPVPFDPTYWDYLGERGSSPELRSLGFMAWRPGSTQILLYELPTELYRYTFLLATENAAVCELDFKGWVRTPRWSPNGRYLAVVKPQDGWLSPYDLVVLDGATGKLYSMGVIPQEAPDRHLVVDFAWAPDNRHLLVLGTSTSYPGCSTSCREDTRLYLADFLTGQVDALLPSHHFESNGADTSLAWSPDGSKVLALCPNLCLVSVQTLSQ